MRRRSRRTRSTFQPGNEVSTPDGHSRVSAVQSPCAPPSRAASVPNPDFRAQDKTGRPPAASGTIRNVGPSGCPRWIARTLLRPRHVDSRPPTRPRSPATPRPGFRLPYGYRAGLCLPTSPRRPPSPAPSRPPPSGRTPSTADVRPLHETDSPRHFYHRP